MADAAEYHVKFGGSITRISLTPDHFAEQLVVRTLVFICAEAPLDRIICEECRTPGLPLHRAYVVHPDALRELNVNILERFGPGARCADEQAWLAVDPLTDGHLTVPLTVAGKDFTWRIKVKE